MGSGSTAPGKYVHFCVLFGLQLTALISLRVIYTPTEKQGTRNSPGDEILERDMPLLRLTPPTERYPWDDLGKILHGGQRMAKVAYKMAKKYCRKFQRLSIQSARTLQKADDRRFTIAKTRT